jgi:predicted lipoprotein with Yx(FWY)xxD motif
MRGATKLVIGIIILVIIAGGAYAVFHKSPKTNNSSTNSSSQTSNNNPPASTNQTPPAAGIIQTKTDSSLGQYLADGSGKTLYTYSLDTTNTSNCTGSCLADWPAYVQTSTSASLPANVTTFKRADNGANQYAYKGMPLYYYSGDSSAGQLTGNGVNNFSVAKP